MIYGWFHFQGNPVQEIKWKRKEKKGKGKENVNKKKGSCRWKWENERLKSYAYTQQLKQGVGDLIWYPFTAISISKLSLRFLSLIFFFFFGFWGFQKRIWKPLSMFLENTFWNHFLNFPIFWPNRGTWKGVLRFCDFYKNSPTFPQHTFRAFSVLIWLKVSFDWLQESPSDAYSSGAVRVDSEGERCWGIVFVGSVWLLGKLGEEGRKWGNFKSRVFLVFWVVRSGGWVELSWVGFCFILIYWIFFPHFSQQPNGGLAKC